MAYIKRYPTNPALRKTVIRGRTTWLLRTRDGRDIEAFSYPYRPDRVDETLIGMGDFGSVHTRRTPESDLLVKKLNSPFAMRDPEMCGKEIAVEFMNELFIFLQSEDLLRYFNAALFIEPTKLIQSRVYGRTLKDNINGGTYGHITIPLTRKEGEEMWIVFRAAFERFSMRYAHLDLCLENVMYNTKTNSIVVIDMDSCTYTHAVQFDRGRFKRIIDGFQVMFFACVQFTDSPPKKPFRG